MSHAVTARVGVGADAAFAFLIDPAALGRWSLGCMDVQPVGGGVDVYTGVSLFDGSRGWLSIDADPLRRVVDYHVGTLDVRQPRISARVIPGLVCGYGADVSLVTLTAWRTVDMTDERWLRLVATHAAEIWLIKAQMEARGAGFPNVIPAKAGTHDKPAA